MEETAFTSTGHHWQDALFVFQPSCLALIITASATVIMAAMRSLKHEIDAQHSGFTSSAGIHGTAFMLDRRHTLLIPLLGSLVLLLSLFLFQAVQFIIIVCVCGASAIGVFFAFSPFVHALDMRWPQVFRLKHIDKPSDLLLALLSGSTVLAWLLTGSVLLNNLLGICLCLTFVSFVKLPNLRICTTLFGSLFLYDVFWVFFSSKLFGHNVMVDVATRQADNPAFSVAAAMHLPTSSLAPKLDLPVKLMFPQNLFNKQWTDPYLMLGLGDIAMPGLIFSLLLSIDVHCWHVRSSRSAKIGPKYFGFHNLCAWKFWKRSYMLPCLIGYALGLGMTLAMASLFQAAQPALLYLVPGTLGTASAVAISRGEFWLLWEGCDEDEDGVSV